MPDTAFLPHCLRTYYSAVMLLEMEEIWVLGNIGIVFWMLLSCYSFVWFWFLIIYNLVLKMMRSTVRLVTNENLCEPRSGVSCAVKFSRDVFALLCNVRTPSHLFPLRFGGRATWSTDQWGTNAALWSISPLS